MNEQQLTTNLSYCEGTLELKRSIEYKFLELGERLKKISNERLYEPQWTSFGEYVGEMKMSESTASKLINIYQKFIVDYGISRERLLVSGDWSVLAEVLPIVRDKESAEEALHMCKELSRQDIRKYIKEQKTGIDMRDCVHDFYTLQICRTCGEKVRLLDDNE